MNVEKIPTTLDEESLAREKASLDLALQVLCWLASAVLAISVTLSIAVAGYMIPRELKGADRWHFYAAYFLASFLTNIAAAAAIYLVSYLATRRYKQFQLRALAQTLVVDPIIQRLRPGTITAYKSVWDAPWENAIENAKTIDVCVQGWDSLVKRYNEHWEKFFRNGGCVHLIMPDVEGDTIFHVVKRMKRSDANEQKREIRNTEELLRGLRTKGENGMVISHTFKAMIWYCIVRFDNDVAFLSCYEHGREPTSGIRSPLYRIELNPSSESTAWISKELEFLMASENSVSKRYDNDTPAPTQGQPNDSRPVI